MSASDLLKEFTQSFSLEKEFDRLVHVLVKIEGYSSAEDLTFIGAAEWKSIGLEMALYSKLRNFLDQKFGSKKVIGRVTPSTSTSTPNTASPSPSKNISTLNNNNNNNNNNIAPTSGFGTATLVSPIKWSKKSEWNCRLTVAELLSPAGQQYIGKTIVVAGWVRTVRDQSKFAFVHLNDGSSVSTLQIVVTHEREGFNEITASGAGLGASIWAEGELIKSIGKEQSVELQCHRIKVIGKVSPDFPLAKFSKAPSREFLRDIAHLRCRTNLFSCMQRVRNALAYATHKFWQDLGFFYLHTPILTASDCEGAGEMFQVTTILQHNKEDNKSEKFRMANEIPTTIDPEKKTSTGVIDYRKDFFGKPSFLAVSGQLNGEMYACGMSKVYTFGPTFRAENSNTTRHVAEFWMIEPEIAFCDLSDNMDYAEAYVKYCIRFVLENCSSDMNFFDKWVEKGIIKRLTDVLNASWTRITYTEAVDRLVKEKKAKFEVAPKWGDDLRSEHERYLCEKIFKGPVFVTDYPKEFKAFYMRLNEDNQTVKAVDLLVPGIGELIGGSQREERIEVLERRIKEMNLEVEGYKPYLDLRRFGTVPHSGFGLGFERLIMFCTGIENIRDVLPFPRTPLHCEF